PVTIITGAPSQGDSSALNHQQRGKASAERNLEKLVELMRRKNLISAAEAARLTGKPVPAGEANAAGAAVESEKERIDKIAARVTAEVMKSLPEEVKKQVRQQLPKEVQEGEKGKAGKITADITAEISKNLQARVRNDIKEELPVEIKKAGVVAPAPDWTRRISLGGDIRLRYENDRFDPNNPDFLQPPIQPVSPPFSLINTRINQDRFKYRVRLGAAAQVNDQVKAVIRLSTGNTSTPVSTNYTLGSYFNRDTVLFDLAFLQWRPLPCLTITGGRMPNPWLSTDLVWAKDLNFDGLAFNARQPVSKSLTSFLTVGAFPLQQYDFSSRSKWLVAGQLGLEKQKPKGIGYDVGAAYYYFSNVEGVVNNTLNPDQFDWTAPLFIQKGNTLVNISVTPNVFQYALASKFRELDLTGNLDIDFWDPCHIVLLGDFVKNLGFNRNDIFARTGISNIPSQDTVGYQFGVAVGYPATLDLGQWKAYLAYKHLEADAVVDAFTDSDFHLGGTNAKGWILGTDIGLRRNTWLTLRWLTADEVSGPPLAIDVLQVDLNALF
ncbi:MAG: putative porin, partial [Nitrospiraceae bacterium]|nr:putative porin [Nitrospiraceae bacterium]